MTSPMKRRRLRLALVTAMGSVAVLAVALYVATERDQAAARKVPVGGRVLAAATVAEPAATATVAAPSARAFARDFAALTRTYATAHGDRARIGRVDCVEPVNGDYMCSYSTQRPGRTSECRIMR